MRTLLRRCASAFGTLTNQAGWVAGSVLMVLGAGALLLAAGSAVRGPGHAATLMQSPTGDVDPLNGLDSVVIFGADTSVKYYRENIYTERFAISNPEGRQYRALITNGTASGQNRVNIWKVRVNGNWIVNAGNVSGTYKHEAVLAMAAEDTVYIEPSGPVGSYIQVKIVSIADPEFTMWGPQQVAVGSYSGGDTMFTFTRPAGSGVPRRMYIVNGAPNGSNRADSARVWLNGQSIFWDDMVAPARYSFSKTVTNVNASNNVAVRVTGPAGAYVTVRAVARDTTPPSVSVTAPVDSLLTRDTLISVAGTVTDQTFTKAVIKTVWSGGQDSIIVMGATLSGQVRLGPGVNTLTVWVRDAANKQTTVTRTVIRDNAAPVLVVNDLADFTQTASITVSGTSQDDYAQTVSANGVGLTLQGTPGASPRAFSGSVPLTHGSNIITTTATDAAGNSTSDVQTVVFDTIPPAITLTAPAEGSSTAADSVVVSGSATDISLPIQWAISSGVVGSSSCGTGDCTFSGKAALSMGANTITVTATDAAGKVGTAVRNVTRTGSVPDTIPPDPATLAPPLPQTQVVSTAEATSFLYTGQNPIQTGVAPGTIETLRAAVLRGKVMRRDGGVLPGAAISIVSHPEYGQTHSRADGMFDMAVNGGGPLVIRFERAGYITSQRQVEVPWQDYVSVDSVMLVGFDTVATTVSPATATQIEVAQSSVSTDGDGSRRATVLFKPGIQAVVTLPGGSTDTLSSLTVRVSEYTVGAGGRAAMPAELPPTSGYTYAAEFSVDQAQAAGATTVEFSAPVPVYVENFLSFPVGTPVPVGYYDRERGMWVPEPNGRVIKIIDATGGTASVDVSGTNQPASQAALDTLGIDSAELASLGGLYSAGQSLWRVRLSHFSPVDFNWPVVVPPDAPPPGPPKEKKDNDKAKDNPDCRTGSIVECQNRILGERLSLTGVPFTLNYRSDRVDGNSRARRLVIPVIGASVPAGLARAEVEVTIAGQVTRQSFAPTANQTYSYIWDGRDGYGRSVAQAQAATIRLSYFYPSGQYAIPASVGQAFNLSCQASAGSPNDCLSAIGERTATEFVFSRAYRRDVGGLVTARAQDIAGWTPGVHHAYDMNDLVLHLGTGERVSAKSSGSGVIRVFAGGISGYSGDGGPASSAALSRPQAIAVGPGNEVYLADQRGRVIRRIAPDGSITTIAGDPSQLCDEGPCGDNGLATDARFRNIIGLAVGMDGTLFVEDTEQNRIRRIDPDGIVRPWAGTGQSWNLVLGDSLPGDEGPATEADLALGGWNFGEMAVLRSGELIFQDGFSYVRLVRNDGTITTIAGTGEECVGAAACGDGGPAKRATMSVTTVAAAADGGYYIYDGVANRIRKVDAAGIIRTYAGNGTSCTFTWECGDGLAATASTLGGNLWQIMEGKDGLYLIDQTWRGGVVRRVGTDGIINTVVGILESATPQNLGAHPSFCDQGVGGSPLIAKAGAVSPGTDACWPNGIAFGPNGTMYLISDSENFVLAVHPALPGVAVGEVVVSSPDGSELYRFSSSGMHLDTKDALSGAVRYTFGYNGNNQLTSIQDAFANTSTIQRDGTGNPTAIVGPYGQTTSLAVDGNGYLNRLVGSGADTTIVTHGVGGLLTALRDPSGFSHAFAYDSVGRLTQDENPSGRSLTPTQVSDSTGFTVSMATGMGRTTTYAIHELANGTEVRTTTEPSGLLRTVLRRPDGSGTVSLPNGMSITYTTAASPVLGTQATEIDSVEVSTPSGARLGLRMRSFATLDSLNPLKILSRLDTMRINGQTFVRAFDGATQTHTLTRPTGLQSAMRLDTLGRVVMARGAGLDSVWFRYDTRGRIDQVSSGSRRFIYSFDSSGRLAAIADKWDRTDSLYYDIAGQLIGQRSWDGRALSFGYDANGRITSVTPPGRPSHGFTLRPDSRVMSYNPPSLGAGTWSTSYAYNIDGDVTKVVRPTGDTIAFNYDNAGRTSSLTFSRGTLATGTLTLGYAPATGKLTSVTNSAGSSLALTYNGALPTAVTWSGPVAGTVAVGYDAAFRVDTVKVNGAGIGFGYDANGLLKNAGALKLERGVGTGLLQADTLGNVSGNWSFDGAGALATYSAVTNGIPLYQVTYVRDSLGRVTSSTEITQGDSLLRAFAYDSAGRLRDVWEGGVLQRTYGYDANGNRTSLTGPGLSVTGSYDDQDRVMSYGTASYLHDRAGFLAAKIEGNDSTHYAYDALGNLLQVRLPNGDLIEYVIDGQNRRVGKKVNGVLVKGWLWQSQLAPAAELDSTGAVVSRFIYATRENVPDYMIKAGATYRLILDQLGSVRLVVNASTGSVAQRIDYDEFGRVVQNTNAGFQPFGFAGGILDDETDLLRFGTRDHATVTGRWTAPDPVGIVVAGTNRYTYGGNDPVNTIDPTGAFPIPECLKGLLKALIRPYADPRMVDIANLEWGIPWWVKGDPDGFTWGDIYLKEGQNLWDPETVALLGHELLHLSDQTHEFGGMTLVWGLDYLLQYGLNRLVGMDDNAAYKAIRTEVRAWELQQAIQEWLRVLDYKPNACCP